MSSLSSRLVIDIGMNNGDDTAYYLLKGFHVVAIEANASLVGLARERFANFLADGRLYILNNALSETPGPTQFFINKDNDHLSSIDLDWARRDQSRCDQVEVEGLTLGQLFGRFGTPYYVKIDIEGADILALRQLAAEPGRPEYVSVEDCRFGPDYISLLAEMGYDLFKLLDQSTVSTLRDNTVDHTFLPASSGPFGPDLAGDWLKEGDFLNLYRTTVRQKDGKRLAPSTQWWDIHAARSKGAPLRATSNPALKVLG